MQRLYLLSLLAWCAGAAGAKKLDNPENRAGTNFPPKVISFCIEKQQQTSRLASRLKAEIPTVVTDYFDAARKGDWAQAFDLFREVRDLLSQPAQSQDQQTVDATVRAAVLEVQLALEQFVEGEPKYALAFGMDIVKSIPPGSD